MTYTHLTTNELVMIEAYVKNEEKVATIARALNRHRQTIRQVVDYLKAGHSAMAYYNQYKANKKRCGRRKTQLSQDELHDIDIFFADPGCPGQRGLNEHSNGLLRRHGLPKKMDFSNVSQAFLSAIADKRNNIPRQSLNYQTPNQVFLSYTKMDNLI